MKKILFALFFAFVATAFAQNFDLKDYWDFDTGYNGVAASIFVGNFKDDGFKEKLDAFMQKIPTSANVISKMNKRNRWLCQEALNEWEYEKDECYIVLCAESRFAHDCILLIVKIIGKDDFDWKGFSLTEKELIEMEKM